MVTLEERVSRNEGVMEQISERMGNLERGQDIVSAKPRVADTCPVGINGGVVKLAHVAVVSQFEFQAVQH